MPDYAVMTAFNGKDNVSHIFDQMRRSADRFGDSARNNMRGVGRDADHASTALRNASKHGYKFGAIVKGILAANAIRGGIGYVTSGLQKVGSDYLQFGDTMVGAVARFDEVDNRSAAFGKEVEKSSIQVRNALIGSRHAAVDGAEAYNELAKAGYNSQQAIGILPNLTAFATAAQEKLGEATKMSSQILGGFGMRSENVQVQLKNHIHLMDMLTKSGNLATGDLRDMFETMKVVAPLAKQKGIAPETAMAMAVALSNAGIMGEEAGTAMKRGMLSLYGPRVAERLVASGINPYDKAGNRRKITDVYGDFARVVSKRKPAEQEAAYYNVFGMYGLSGNTKLTEELANIAKYEEALKHVDDYTKNLAAAANSSPLAKLMMVGNAVIEKGFKVLDRYAEGGKSGLDTLLDKIQRFDVTPVITGLSMAGRVIGQLYRMAEPFLPMMPYIIGGFVSWKVALEGIAAAKAFITLMKVGKTMWDIGAALVAGLGPMGAMTTAVEALGIALARSLAPLVAAAPVLSTVLAILAASGYTSNAMRDNGWGDARTTQDYLDEARSTTAWEAPNTQAARAQASRFDGVLRISGAPAGSTFSNNLPGMSPLTVTGLGANP